MQRTQVVTEEVARWAKELGKGATRLAVLSVLAEKESYGYQILATLKERGANSVGTTEAAIYPILKDLEARGHLTSRWKDSAEGVPARKYYRVTPAGTQLLAAMRQAWRDYVSEMGAMMEP